MRRTWFVVACWAAAAGATAAQDSKDLLPQEKVREAIEWGRTASEQDLRQYELKSGSNWVINFDTPFLRVAQLAAATARLGKLLTENDIPERFAANLVDVYAHAQQGVGEVADLPNFEYLTISKPSGSGRSELLLPKIFDRFVRQVPIPGYYGPARIAHSVRASFPAGSLVPGVQVRLVLQGGVIEVVPVEAPVLARVR